MVNATKKRNRLRIVWRSRWPVDAELLEKRVGIEVC